MAKLIENQIIIVGNIQLFRRRFRISLLKLPYFYDMRYHFEFLLARFKLGSGFLYY